jgi:hypothetical protein
MALAVFTIATMPARSASGRSVHRSTIKAKSGDFLDRNAKQNAKFRAPSSQVFDLVRGWVERGADCKSATSQCWHM